MIIFIQEANIIGGQISELWQRYNDLIRSFPKKHNRFLSSIYKDQLKKEYYKYDLV